uniref:Uncharacterized protein n=1 Tax=Rhizophora mucronata TaxID=61149 RepID=A0A2P2NHI5_RHIMU
MASFTPHFQ